MYHTLGDDIPGIGDRTPVAPISSKVTDAGLGYHHWVESQGVPVF
jgi:hypothetical protein